MFNNIVSAYKLCILCARNLSRQTSNSTEYELFFFQGNSGYNRAQQIQQSFPNSNLSVLYNKAEMSCFLAALPSSVFADNAMHVLDSWTVTPLTSYMKIRAGSVEGIESAHESAEDFKSISFTVCLAATEEQESAEIADGILTRIQARDEQGRSLATEKFHWTRSDVEHDRRLSRTHHTRIARWRQAMEEGINAEHQCQSLFDEIETLPTSDENEFLFTMGHGDIGDPSSSASAHCMLSLVASLAAQPEVCSVENLPQNKEVNDIAQWITQSYQKDYRPFWDAGLLGEGQVVQVSDSGLDTNNCYFWDEGGEVVKDKSQVCTHVLIIALNSSMALLSRLFKILIISLTLLICGIMFIDNPSILTDCGQFAQKSGPVLCIQRWCCFDERPWDSCHRFSDGSPRH